MSELQVTLLAIACFIVGTIVGIILKPKPKPIGSLHLIHTPKNNTYMVFNSYLKIDEMKEIKNGTVEIFQSTTDMEDLT